MKKHQYHHTNTDEYPQIPVPGPLRRKHHSTPHTSGCSYQITEFGLQYSTTVYSRNKVINLKNVSVRSCSRIAERVKIMNKIGTIYNA